MLTNMKHIFTRVQAYHQPVRVILGRNGLGCTCLDVGTALLERYPVPGQTTGQVQGKGTEGVAAREELASLLGLALQSLLSS